MTSSRGKAVTSISVANPTAGRQRMQKDSARAQQAVSEAEKSRADEIKKKWKPLKR